jgi:hypothetical protein
MAMVFYIVEWWPNKHKRLLCERLTYAHGIYMLYTYDRRRDVYIDYGCAKDMTKVRYMLAMKYNMFGYMELYRHFEDVANLFTTRHLPRLIYVDTSDMFCTREGDTLAYLKFKYDGRERVITKIDWRLDGPPPKDIYEALVRLNDYANGSTWVVFKIRAGYALAYEVYPSP